MVANSSSSQALTNAREKCATLPAREVHRRLKESLVELHRAERNVVLWFAEIVRRKIYKELGYSSVHQYAEIELGFGMSKTSQFLRLAGSLEHLPNLRRALARGEIPWTTAREVATVATPKNEARWIAEAKEVPRRVLESRTAETRRRARTGSSGNTQVALEVGPAGAGSLSGLEDSALSPGKVDEPPSSGPGVNDGIPPRSEAGTMVDPATPVNVGLRMTAEQYARYQALLETLRKQKMGVDAVEIVLATLEQAVVAGESPDVSEVTPTDFPRGKVRRSPYQVIVQTCPDCNRATVPTSRGEKTLTPQELRTILCDAYVRGSGKKNKASIPPRLRGAVLERDRYRCRAAGCGRASFLAVHHKVPREAGGPNTLENLNTLCSGCHRALHGHP